jgi:hypothetical protein
MYAEEGTALDPVLISSPVHMEEGPALDPVQVISPAGEPAQEGTSLDPAQVSSPVQTQGTALFFLGPCTYPSEL